MNYTEGWIEAKLKERLEKYRERYPNFNVERVMGTVAGWDDKSQRWAPYMKDKDIKAINRRNQKARSMASLAKNEHL